MKKLIGFLILLGWFGFNSNAHAVDLSTQFALLRSAVDSMPVAADRPPMNTSSASSGCFSAIGRVSTKVSASTSPAGKCRRPPKASGSTKMLIASM